MADAPPPAARILGEAPVPIWSMSSAERLRRSLSRAGVEDVAPWPGTAAPDRGLLLLRADQVYDPGLIAALVRQPGTLLLSPEGGLPVAAHLAADGAAAGAADGTGDAATAGTGIGTANRTGAGTADRAAGVAAALLAGAPRTDPAFAAMRAGGPAELGDAHNKALRKREVPYLLPLRADTVRAAEWRTFTGSYKGVTDIVTKHVWPVPAFHVTRLCAALGIGPNPVTWVSLGLVFLAMWLFAQGHFLPGLLAAWGMTFLDTVDGKLARTTLRSTKFGNVLDHGTDLIHPPFWYYAWVVGLAHVGMPVPQPWWVLAVVLGGYVLQRLEEGLFISRFGIEMHVWRRFDSAFRSVTARRNPNLLLLSAFALAGRPDWGMLAVAAWTLLSLVVHTAQIAQAFRATARGQPPTSWLAG
ncbi:CDP-alcohol phosphatidyltransferase family protein [Roseomonas sp. BN140053]|uniref:CDP-alcohol phosphatidyltransferase family protein n=1 Tax=Roseomonas sp. BN140053 TaxID=3391898 RepID=UPI0039E7F1A2